MFLCDKGKAIPQIKSGFFLAFNELVWIFCGLFLALFGFFQLESLGQVAKFASGLFCCWSLMCNNNTATNLLMFTSSYNIGVLPHVSVERRHLGRYRVMQRYSDC